MKEFRTSLTIEDPKQLVLSDLPFREGQEVDVVIVAKEPGARIQQLKELLKATQSLPHVQTLTEEDIADNGNREHLDGRIETLKKALEELPDDDGKRTELQALLNQRLDEKLKEAGLVKEVRGPITDFTPYQNRTLMPAEGKPLSEIVIENRR